MIVDPIDEADDRDLIGLVVTLAVVAFLVWIGYRAGVAHERDHRPPPAPSSPATTVPADVELLRFTVDTQARPPAPPSRPASAELGRFLVTCYGPPDFPAGQHTATGRPVGPGSLAVDPQVIPLGSRLLVAGELVVADDTGGAIHGHHVDLWRPSCARWPNPRESVERVLTGG